MVHFGLLAGAALGLGGLSHVPPTDALASGGDVPLRCAHYSLFNNSGLHNLAATLVEAEKKIGLDAVLVNGLVEATWEPALDADVHICHVHFPPAIVPKLTKPPKVVWIGHGAPEHTFHHSVADGLKGGYGFGDSFMMMMHWLQAADARVTFWPRHQALYETMVDKGTKVYLVPQGVDKAYWAPGPTRGKWGGNPSLWTGENSWRSKDPLDLLLMWKWVSDVMTEAVLHVNNLAQDQHRWWLPLAYRNGSAFRAHLSDMRWGKEDLRNVFRSIDYFIGLVRYGDFNQVQLQAVATGTKTISYQGNPYAHYWLTEGDQRVMAQELLRILKGETEPRTPDPVPDISETATAMKAIYEEVAA